MSSIFIDTSQLVKGADRLKNMGAELETTVDHVLDSSLDDIRLNVLQRIPVNEGYLKGSVLPIKEHLKKTLAVNAKYGSAIEFGTGAYAAAYVASLPSDWQTFASQFKGQPTGGTFKEMVLSIAEWIRHKGLGNGSGGTIGIAGTYSIKTRRRTGSKSTQEKQNLQLAYVIARSILKRGIKPHPFLYPAFAQQRPILEQDLENALKQFGR